MSNTYLVKELFESLQGEGARAGCLSVFIRLAGCNNWSGHPNQRGVGQGMCSLWCDTDFRPDGARKMTAREIAEAVTVCWGARPGQPWVVFTGGEPLLQLDSELVDHLHENDIQVAAESNGTVEPKCGLIDWLTVSPKLDHLGRPQTLKVQSASELKIVLPGAPPGYMGWYDDDLIEVAASGKWGRKFVQPQDPIASTQLGRSHLVGGIAAEVGATLYNENVRRCIKWVKRHPDWSLSIQTHKLMRLP